MVEQIDPIDAVENELALAKCNIKSFINNRDDPEVYRDAIRSLYYAVFHFAKALLLSRGINTITHQATIQQFSQHFVKEGIFPSATSKELNRLMDDRHTADYKGFTDFTFDDVDMWFSFAGEFISTSINNLEERMPDNAILEDTKAIFVNFRQGKHPAY